MGYYERYIDRLINTNYKNCHFSIDKAREYAVELIDARVIILEDLKSKNVELTEREKSFEQAYCLFKTEENYIKHKKEKENKTMTNTNTNTAVATTTATNNWSYGKGYTYTSNPPVGFTYHGRKNKTILPDFIDICKMSQKKLKQFLVKELKKYYDKDKIHARDGFLFAEGNIPVMITAHMDTVHSNPIKDYYEWTEEQVNKEKNFKYDIHVLSSPQGIGGDDRCGIWSILQILSFGYRPFILFNEDEEIGCIGAKKFCRNKDLIQKCKDKGMKFIVEMDRKNKHDLVFYDCDNRDFTKWCEKVTGWKENYGSCSDISYLAPEIECAAVNLSCGYYDEHKLWHTVKIEEMFNTMATCIKLIEASEKVEAFEYVEAYNYYNYSNRYYSGWGYDYDYGYSSSKANSSYNKNCAVEFEYVVYNSSIDDWQTYYKTEKGKTFDECYKNFFKNNPDVCWNDILNEEEYYLDY